MNKQLKNIFILLIVFSMSAVYSKEYIQLNSEQLSCLAPSSILNDKIAHTYTKETITEISTLLLLTPDEKFSNLNDIITFINSYNLFNQDELIELIKKVFILTKKITIETSQLKFSLLQEKINTLQIEIKKEQELILLTEEKTGNLHEREDLAQENINLLQIDVGTLQIEVGILEERLNVLGREKKSRRIIKVLKSKKKILKNNFKKTK